MRLHRFHGGLNLAGHKAESSRDGLRDCPLPGRLQVSMLQHAGQSADPCVAAGDTVVAGQRIGRASSDYGADVHAPASGRVIAIAARPVPRFPGVEAQHVIIEVEDSGASPHRLASLPWQDATPTELRERMRDAGIVGLGGAGFPTAEKLSVDRQLLVLNGAECEPWISCDDALLREHTDEVVLGGCLLARAIGATRVLLAIEQRMHAALAAAQLAAATHAAGVVEIVVVPGVYPEGGERQLIEVLTGKEVPRGGSPGELGILVQNVATVRAAWRAVTLGEVLTERIVSVTGRGVANPGNYRVPLGTSVSHLVLQAGGYTPDAARLLLGGPMTGESLPHDDFPIGKTHPCVLVQVADEHATIADPLPCIRCGDCASVCPAQLLPQQLLWHVRADRLDRAQDQGVFDCIECGCCDLVCPSHIPLTTNFRQAKSGIRVRALAADRAMAARERHESRQLRHLRESQERADRDALRQSPTGAGSADAVAAALARARAKRASAQDPDATP